MTGRARTICIYFFPVLFFVVFYSLVFQGVFEFFAYLGLRAFLIPAVLRQVLAQISCIAPCAEVGGGKWLRDDTAVKYNDFTTDPHSRLMHTYQRLYN